MPPTLLRRLRFLDAAFFHYALLDDYYAMPYD